MSAFYTQKELDVIQVCGTVTSIISLSAILYVSRSFYRERESLSIASKLVGVLFVFDFGLTICYGVGRQGARHSGFCQLQVR